MHTQQSQLRVAMVGTRGVPAHYGGFETAIEEIGSRLVDRGVEVTVYCRPHNEERPSHHLGMKLVHLPALRLKTGETLSHTALSAMHMLRGPKFDAAFLFNAANAPFLPLLRRSARGVAVHVDGLEWKRSKWGGRGRSYYRWAEQASVRGADALIADAAGIASYYRNEFNADTRLLVYGAPEKGNLAIDKLDAAGLVPGGFHLVVARFEPENHVDQILEGYRSSKAQLPLVVVGSAPYAAAYTEQIKSLAAGDSRIRLLGGVWDQELLSQLYTHARTYIHGHSVGGTNPSLLRSMGSGTAVLAYDVVFNREVLGADAGRYFDSAARLTGLIEELDADEGQARAMGASARERAQAAYRWDDVAEGYLRLAKDLASGSSTRNRRAVRNPDSGWKANGPDGPGTLRNLMPELAPASAPPPTRPDPRPATDVVQTRTR
ncbi:DUF1972 domain-containing protein [Arthrobacter koreensis]|uniref:DUF1972 domain-containing protein n=1 Tax=Arthrobacter koreensis TaxID=199136 RepID=UPI002DBA9F82|nr:DUF1972 domain-containing protein [Arthrobacter koreensis]MEB7505232.1 DUF1972 domain-containing protein [Arthrobacter koreensis]